MLKKRSIIIVFMLLLIIALTACGGGATPEPEPVPEPIPDETLSTKTGTLIEASMHVLSIQAPDGSTYTFVTDDDTTIEGSELLGNTMSVTYFGDYAPGIVAFHIETIREVDHDNSDGKGSTKEPDAPQPSNPPATNDPIFYLTGTVKDISDNGMKLLYEDGKTYSVVIDGNTKKESGIVVGCIARVFHKGSIRDGMLATEIKFIKAAPKPEDAIRYLTGRVTEITANGLKLLYEDGKTYSIIKDANTKMASGIVVDCIAVFSTKEA